jgi:hypothetical protein
VKLIEYIFIINITFIIIKQYDGWEPQMWMKLRSRPRAKKGWEPLVYSTLPTICAHIIWLEAYLCIFWSIWYPVQCLLSSNSPSVCTHGETHEPLHGFSWNLIFENFMKNCLQFSFRLENFNNHITSRSTCISTISWTQYLSKWKMFQPKVVEKNEYFMHHIFFTSHGFQYIKKNQVLGVHFQIYRANYPHHILITPKTVITEVFQLFMHLLNFISMVNWEIPFSTYPKGKK